MTIFLIFLPTLCSWVLIIIVVFSYIFISVNFSLFNNLFFIFKSIFYVAKMRVFFLSCFIIFPFTLLSISHYHMNTSAALKAACCGTTPGRSISTR
uniref:Uncharacterized protein n=1 Tax=Ixodes ricinus TaxID=34613 RepID=A0A147BCR2_IXORI